MPCHVSSLQVSILPVFNPPEKVRSPAYPKPHGGKVVCEQAGELLISGAARGTQANHAAFPFANKTACPQGATLPSLDRPGRVSAMML